MNDQIDSSDEEGLAEIGRLLWLMGRAVFGLFIGAVACLPPALLWEPMTYGVAVLFGLALCVGIALMALTLLWGLFISLKAMDVEGLVDEQQPGIPSPPTWPVHPWIP